MFSLFLRVGMLSNCREGVGECSVFDIVGCQCPMGWNLFLDFC